MRKDNEKVWDTDIYERIREARMSESEREVAINAMRNAERIADAILWLGRKIESLSTLFLRPGLKH
jgi:hypothetical protein